MNESLVKYLAGLLDADGSLSLTFRLGRNTESRYHPGLMMKLSASDAVDQRGFVESLPALTGMGTVSRYGNSNQFAVWSISRRADLEMLLPRLIKHMVIKARHWQWLLETWRETRGPLCSDAERARLTAASKRSRVERAGPMHPKNHPTWAWLAGYLDGDGWYIYRRDVEQNYWAMNVGAVAHNNDIGVLQFLQKSFGGNIRNHGQSPNVSVWVRSLGVRDASFALRFLPNIAKHSRLKRYKIDQMIHHHRQRLSVPSSAEQATV